jgi:anti-anti-sigma factor
MNVIESKLEGGTLHLVVKASKLDAATSRIFKRECEALCRDPVERITIDLEAVEFLDSSGVGALLSVYKRLPKERPVVKLLHAKAPVQSVIELLRLHRIFELES